MFLTLPQRNNKVLDNYFLHHRSLQSEINPKPYSLKRILKLNAADQQVRLKPTMTFLLILFHQIDKTNGQLLFHNSLFY